ncbi:hypothetical protein [Flavobacterium sp. 3HN19-14]|uniref:hypothetical protein n=1 Tax=Flavobacterium sp. 3HN19-14 TaxID=3448133 RepID=UPI003EE372E9
MTLHSNTRCGSNINVLEVYDTSNINLPSLITQVDLIQPKGLGLYGNYLFVCDAGLVKIFDVQNPGTPTVVHTLEIDCHDVIISGNDLFAIGDTGLFRYKLHPDDITNITSESNIIF